MKKTFKKIDQMLCENIVDFENADVDWESLEQVTELVVRISNENQKILDLFRTTESQFNINDTCPKCGTTEFLCGHNVR